MTTLPLRQSLSQKLGQLPDAELAQVLDFVDFLLSKQNQPIVHASESKPLVIPSTYDENAVPLWEVVANVADQMPDEEWKKIPTDLARRFDAYQGSQCDANDIC